MSGAEAIERAIAEKKVIVCVGAGGVGKTTVAAALGLRAAAQGRRVLVLTIDPARRLAASLGLTEIGNVETHIEPEKLRAAGIEPRGELWAMMLDLKRTWDDLIARHASADSREEILQSRFYQQLSSALAGSQEYVAMDKLLELRRSGGYDLLVLDTPPTAHALDFLDAPNRVLEFVGNERVRSLVAPALRAGHAGLKMLSLTSGYFVRTVSRMTGIGLLEELARFLATLAPMYDVFKQRAVEVKALLGSPETAFVLVTSPKPLTIDESIFFHTLLVQDPMPVAAIVANRVITPPGASETAEAIDALAAQLDGAEPGRQSDPAAERLRRSLGEIDVLARADERELKRLAAGCDPTPVIGVPRLDEDVHDLAGLWRLDQALFDSGLNGRGL
jgi:anion-transporting  ArsA/GET3 family ATPase